MKTKLYYSLLTLILTSQLCLFAQDNTLIALQEKYKNDQAVVIENKQTITISVNSSGTLDIFETNYEEILYLKNSARFYTSQNIYLSDFFEDLISVDAYVIKTDGKKLKLKKEDYRIIDSEPSSWVFHDDDKEMIFELPQIRPGFKSVITYTKKLKRPEFFDRFHFVGGYPIIKGIIQLVIDPNVQVNFYERAFGKYNVDKKETTDKKGNKMITYQLNDIAPFYREYGSTNINNHLPHIVAQIVGYKYSGKQIDLIGNLDQLHAFYEDLLLQKQEVESRDEIIDVTDAIIKNKTTSYEKMDTIYKWVQENIKYIAFEDGINGYVPRSSDVVMKNRFGDCKDMSNLLVEMLTHAGVENAFVAWVGTNEIPYQMSDIPSPLTCNHVITVVEKSDGGFYYLDATGSEMGIVLPPDVVQEKEILIHKGPGKYQLYKVPAVEAKYNYYKLNVSFYYDEKTDSIYGKGSDYWGGYERESRSYELKNSDPEDLFDYVKDITLGGRNRFGLLDYTLHNVHDNNKELVIDYKFTADNLLIKDGNTLILNPILFKPRISKYSHAEYKYDRQKDHHRSVDYFYSFTIPKGYHVKYIPADVIFNHELFELKTTFEKTESFVSARFTYQYHVLVIPPSLFDDWNAFADVVLSSAAQCVVFEKN